MPPAPLPVSDHCDGRRFFNPASILPPPAPAAAGGAPRPGRLLSILRWQWARRRRAAWPVPPQGPAPAGDPHAAPAPGHAHVTFIGHSTFLLRLRAADGSVVTVLTDPVFSDRCSPVRWAGPRRVRPPGRAIGSLPRVDAIVVSHCHYDHMDLDSLAFFARRDAPVVITPPGNARHLRGSGLRDVVECDWWQGHTVGGLRITCTPARHGSARTPFDRNRALWGGFDIRPAEGAAPSVFFAGDSAHGRHWGQIRARLGAPDVALLPVGAYDPRELMAAVHTTPEEAVAAMAELGAAQAIGMHFGTFRLTDEPFDEPLHRLAASCAAAGLDAGRFTWLAHGECRAFAAAAQPLLAQQAAR
ncbi:putative outer membrane protein [Gluconacetobacter diazotrophicus PA1 5]|uniref:Metallo-beta-lactamase domain-containing protein n=1 Tax=Gluconacetobacter diazotrophicus TaxID=33996 RepID=A0A7W4NMD9_GLUDI|nr:putative outer membrane protein [Gluconacetobacter diazotrophicus PA1 5]MBB2156975.1 hypothetical protein [Gluconacetobacter diazotrophicus]TWB02810.1 L-ascorbate metabolism protein UlaG (beta-lactamase superfamily) [Gluconacetobacter diazotrophicus]